MKYFVYLQCYLEGVFYASIAIEYCYCELYIVYNKSVTMKKLLFLCALSAFLMPICGVRAQIYVISQNNHRILRLTPYPTVPIGSFYIPPFYNRVKDTNSDSIIFNSITTLSNSCCMAAAGDSWLILDLLSPLFPQPGNTNSCIFTYTTDCFREPVYTSNEIAEGNSVLYNRAMRLEPGYIGTVDPESPCRPRSIFPAEFEPVKPTE